MRPAVLAVDGGNSKADVALVGPAGELLAAIRGGTVSHQAVGLEAGMDRLARLVDDARRAAGLDGAPPAATIGVYTVAGADYPSDIRLLTRALDGRALGATNIVLNDTFGTLRAGTDRNWGVALICGHGINAAAVAPDGRRARFPSVGEIAGDWGGGTTLGMEALAAAIRGRDGRGPRTVLERAVPLHFGLSRPSAVTRAMYSGRIAEARAAELSPVVFEAAMGGDAVARSIVDRLADELVAMGSALIRRLHLARLDPEIVLGGGVFRTEDGAFFERLAGGIQAVAPRASLVRLAAPPVVGAALLGLDRLAGHAVDVDTAGRLRAAFARWKPERRPA